MKKNSLLWSLAAASMMFFASCENENVPGATDAQEATVAITIASNTRSSESKVDGEGRENEINKLEAYTFNGNTLIDYAQGDVSSSTTKAISLKAQIGSVKVVVVANSSIGKEKELGQNYTFNDLKNVLSTFTFTPTSSTTIPNSGFVMSAIEDYTLVEGTNPKTISIKRTVSKFEKPNFENVATDLSTEQLIRIQDVFPTFKASDDKSKITFAYSNEFAFANGLNKSMLFNGASYDDATWWPAVKGTGPTSWIPGKLSYIKSQFESDGSYKAGGVYSNGFINKAIYVHENFPYIVYDENDDPLGYDATEVYCFIVKGTLTWADGVGEDAKAKTRYWRINLVKNTTGDPTNDYYRIFRNGYYKVSVDLVKTVGHNTPEEAEKETPIIPIEGDATVTITVTPAPWDIYISETQM